MKIMFKGKFNGDLNTLPNNVLKPNSVRFKETTDIKKFSIITNIISSLLLLALFVFYILYARIQPGEFKYGLISIILFLPALFIKVLMYAICFTGTAYIYTYFSKGLIFVVGTGDMTKFRFVFMNVFPNVVLGIIPFLIFLFFPTLHYLGLFGALMIPFGVGDYYNAFNAIRQMPKGSKTYMYGVNSYWYFSQ